MLPVTCMKLDAFEKLVWLSFLIFQTKTIYLGLYLNECMLCRYRVSVLCLLEQHLKLMYLFTETHAGLSCYLSLDTTLSAHLSDDHTLCLVLVHMSNS